MTNKPSFGDILDAIAKMPVEQQEELVEVVQQRINAIERQRIVNDIKEAEAEYARGDCRVMSVEEIMQEIES